MTRVAVLAFLSISAIFSLAQSTKPALTQTQVEAGNPLADQSAIVSSGNARFTVLTAQLVRMEWAEDGKFEDHATLMFINRRLNVPHFTRKTENGWLVLT